MSRIGELFADKKQNILNVYFTAGFPALENTLPVMKSLQDAGADMIELGMPYSDPLADGPVIQSSSAVALANGMTIRKLFEQLKNFRKEIQLPVLLMGYMNPILQYGFENFCREAAEAGVDGLILPDLPMYEFEKEYGSIIHKYKLDFVFLVTPETPETRIRQLDLHSSGFLYAVSSSSTTGNSASLGDQEAYFKKLQSMKLKNPVLIGFGIKDRSGFLKACSYASGAIVGTAFIKILEKASEQEIPERVQEFINSLK
ncbi:MAG TPA: tryptophan synthase subunit alpha [Chitinophagaceae bacterium]|nr:tryptophan synthase subunit alpha [Chitinophagaceae bacterium]